MIQAQGRMPRHDHDDPSRPIFDVLPTPAWLADPDGARVWFNRAFRDFAGLPPDDLLAGGWLCAVHPDDRIRVSEAWAGTMSTGSGFEVEYRLRRADGEFRWHIDRANPRPDGLGWVGTLTDIHEGKSTQDAHRRTTSVLDAITEAMFVVDHDWRLTYLNLEAERAFGRPRGEMLGQCLWDFYPEAIGSTFHEEYLKAFRTGVPVAFEAIYKPTGAWSAVRAYPGPDGLTVFFHDVSSRKETDEARIRSEFLLRLIWDDAADGMRLTDEQGTVVMANAAYCRLIGRPASEVVGRPFYDAFAPEQRERVIQSYRERFAVRGHKPRIEVEGRFWDGRTRWVELADSILDLPGASPQLLCVVRDVTERRRTEDALREREQFLRSVIDNIPSGVFWKDRNSAFLGCNTRVALDVGAGSPEALIGKTDRATSVSPEQAEHFIADDRRVMETGEPLLNIEESHTRADGVVATLLTSKVPLRDASGNVIGVLGMYTDVTEWRRAEHALRDQEEFLRTILDNIPCAVFWKDRNSVFLGCNAEMARDQGLSSQAEWVGRTDLEMPYTPEEAAFYRECDRRVMETGQPLLNVEETQTRGDGSTATLLTSKVPLRDAKGNVIGVLGIYMDITDRKVAEEAARRSQALFKAFMDNSPLIAYIKDEDGRFIYANRRFEERESPARRDWLGKSDSDYWPPEAVAIFRESDRLVLETNQPVERVESVTTPTGEVRQFHTLKFPVVDATGRRAIGGITQDVTNQRRLEEQVRQAQKTEAVGRMAGGIAHDFNNILTAVTGFGELALEELSTDTPARDWVTEMVKAGNRAAALTRQLLAFSRKQVLHPRLIDLNALVSDLERMLRRLIGEDVDLATRLAPTVGRVLADPGSVEQVIVNLAVNARDAMPSGGCLTIETAEADLDEEYASTRTEVRPGRYGMIAVTDTGVGMTPEVKARLFEPFFTTKPVGQGTGLGLAVVHGAVKQAGGHVEVYSEPGLGTTVKVYFPIAEPTDRDPSSRLGKLPVTGGTETILLVEDEAAVRSLASRVLRRAGYTVMDAGDAREALAVAAAHSGRIDLVVTDVVMPGGGGRAMAEQLTATHPEARVLYMSGYTDDAVVRHGVLADRVYFLQKPFTPGGLTAKVREVLDATHGGAAR